MSEIFRPEKLDIHDRSDFGEFMQKLNEPSISKAYFMELGAQSFLTMIFDMSELVASGQLTIYPNKTESTAMHLLNDYVNASITPGTSNEDCCEAIIELTDYAGISRSEIIEVVNSDHFPMTALGKNQLLQAASKPRGEA